jgi:hypothetical protein
MPGLFLPLPQPAVFLAAKEFTAAQDAFAFGLVDAAVGAPHHIFLGNRGLRRLQAFPISPEYPVNQPDAYTQQNEFNDHGKSPFRIMKRRFAMIVSLTPALSRLRERGTRTRFARFTLSNMGVDFAFP